LSSPPGSWAGISAWDGVEAEIAAYGVMGTPAVVLDDEVKSVGRVPGKREILDWLK